MEPRLLEPHMGYHWVRGDPWTPGFPVYFFRESQIGVPKSPLLAPQNECSKSPLFRQNGAKFRHFFANSSVQYWNFLIAHSKIATFSPKIATFSPKIATNWRIAIAFQNRHFLGGESPRNSGATGPFKTATLARNRHNWKPCSLPLVRPVDTRD